ncbi:flagellar filament capping protein FliD [Salmonella enterica]|uniref:flagellar filament capping protein FliD n=1 Tax=Salmonella enterica TaxID=28901 RepID=UPI0018E56BAF|nr:flagellar filament capping protein FliD [Salmonella enterica]
MASISSLGVGSNLPLDQLLTDLTKNEKGRLTPITKQQSANSAKLTAYGTLKSALEKFQTANTALNKADLFKSTVASSTTEDLKVSTTAGAAAGTYKINVTQLAAAQSLATKTTFATTKEQLGDTSVTSRTIKIEQPGRKEPLEIKLDKGDTSMEAIRDAINDADSGIAASIVKVKENEFQLVLTANSGTDNTMKITALTLTKKVTDATVTVTKDDTKAKEAIKSWVDAYNSLVDTFSSLTKYTAVEPGEEASDKNGALLGDSVVRTIQTGIRAQFANSGSNSAFKTMAEIGITQDGTSGKLKIDDDKLTKVLKDNTAAARELLVGDGKETGITTKIATEVKSYLADDGIIDNAQDNVNATLKSLTKQYLSVSNSIDETVARYKAQFTQLDTMMSKLNNTCWAEQTALLPTVIPTSSVWWKA